MKNLLSITIIQLTILLFVSCEKEEQQIEDYRLKWIGLYKCQKYCDISNDSAKTIFLNVKLADGDSLLNIKEETDSVPFGQKYKYIDVIVKADSYGDLWYCSGISTLSYNFRASFYGDSLFIRNFLFISHNYAPRYIYKGCKIKESEQ